MHKEDITQVTDIDREAFPTQWPPPNYRHELQNQLARYIVVCDDTKTLEEPEVKPKKGLFSLASKIKQRFNPRNSLNKKPNSSNRQYIVGFAGMWIMSDEAHLTNIAVRQQYQRRGIGELLLLSIMDLAKEMKANIMTLEVRVSNTTAQNLYNKYGFMRVGIRRGYYTDNREDAILMSTESVTSASFQARLQQLRETLAKKGDNDTGENISAVHPKDE